MCIFLYVSSRSEKIYNVAHFAHLRILLAYYIVGWWVGSRGRGRQPEPWPLGCPPGVIYQGTVNASVVRAAEVYRPAVTRNSPAIVVLHNHPSGDPTPSPEDIRTTEQLRHAGEVLDIELLDHIVLGHHQFVSLKERRLGFE